MIVMKEECVNCTKLFFNISKIKRHWKVEGIFGVLQYFFQIRYKKFSNYEYKDED